MACPRYLYPRLGCHTERRSSKAGGLGPLLPLENPTTFGYTMEVPRVFGQVDGFDVKVNRIEDQDETARARLQGRCRVPDQPRHWTRYDLRWTRYIDEGARPPRRTARC